MHPVVLCEQQLQLGDVGETGEHATVIRQVTRVGLPARIAIPILVVFAVVFLGILGWFLRIGFGTTGSAFGPSGAPAQQGDARIAATPAPLATDPPGTFTVPQTGTGPTQGGSNALPGASTGGGNAAGTARAR